MGSGEMLSAGSECLCLMQPFQPGTSGWIKVSRADKGGSRVVVNMAMQGQRASPLQQAVNYRHSKQKMQEHRIMCLNVCVVGTEILPSNAI